MLGWWVVIMVNYDQGCSYRKGISEFESHGERLGVGNQVEKVSGNPIEHSKPNINKGKFTYSSNPFPIRNYP